MLSKSAARLVTATVILAGTLAAQNKKGVSTFTVGRVRACR